MEKEDLEIRKASEELMTEDLKNVNGGVCNLCEGDCNSNCRDCITNNSL